MSESGKKSVFVTFIWQNGNFDCRNWRGPVTYFSYFFRSIVFLSHYISNLKMSRWKLNDMFPTVSCVIDLILKEFYFVPLFTTRTCKRTYVRYSELCSLSTVVVNAKCNSAMLNHHITVSHLTCVTLKTIDKFPKTTIVFVSSAEAIHESGATTSVDRTATAVKHCGLTLIVRYSILAPFIWNHFASKATVACGASRTSKSTDVPGIIFVVSIPHPYRVSSTDLCIVTQTCPMIVKINVVMPT